MKSSKNNDLARNKTNSRLQTALVLNTLVILIEVAGGFYSNSLSILSDAIHNVIDEGTLILTYYSYWVTTRGASRSRTFGEYKMEALAGWINSALLILLTGFLMFEAIQRLIHPQAVQGSIMIMIALIASAGNLAVALSLRKSAGENLNIRTAYLHNLGDAAISLAPVIGGAVILLSGWKNIDSILGLLIGIPILMGTWDILKNSLQILLDRVPSDIQSEKVVESLLLIPEVLNVHDLHIWAVNSKLKLLTVQLLVEDMRISESLALQQTICSLLFENFGIGHSTLQFETSSCRPGKLYCNLAERHRHRVREKEVFS